MKLEILNGAKQNIEKGPSALHIVGGNDGCGAWRMIWPAHAINMHKKANILDCSEVSNTTFIRFDAIRMQRQVTESQEKMFNGLYQIREMMKSNTRFIYEIDDIFLPENIPDFNGAKNRFVNGFSLKSALNIINKCDEMTVTCSYMKNYFMDKFGKKEITVVPNFLPHWWIGGYYDQRKIAFNLDQNKKRPRILYAGSPTHINHSKNGVEDDFTKINAMIRKTTDIYSWVFVGTIPSELNDLVKSGKIEYYPWVSILEFPNKISSLNVNAVIAPLVDNIFNRSKSNIKLTEAGCFGLPGVFQDIDPYKDAQIKFKTPDELQDQLKKLFSDSGYYKARSKDSWDYSKKFMMSNSENLEALTEVYNTPFNGYRPNLAKWSYL